MKKGNIIFEETKNNKEVFRYYRLHSMGYIYDDEEEHSFEKLEDAINYSINSDERDFEPFSLYSIVINKDENGELKTQETNMGKLPSQCHRNVNYYVLGEIQEDDSLFVYKNFSNYDNFTPEKEIEFEDGQEHNDSLGFYEITASINNNNNLEYNYEFIKKLKEKDNKILTKKNRTRKI